MIKHNSISSILLVSYVFFAILFYASSFSAFVKLFGLITAIVFFIESVIGIKAKAFSEIRKYFFPSLLITVMSSISILYLHDSESKFLTLLQVNILSFILIYKIISEPKIFNQILFSFLTALFIGALLSFERVDIERDAGVFGTSVNLYGTALNLGTLFSCFLLLNYFSSKNSLKPSRFFSFSYVIFLFLTLIVFFKKIFFDVGSKKSVLIYIIIVVFFLSSTPKKYFKRQLIILPLLIFYFGSTLLTKFTNSDFFYRFQSFNDSLFDKRSIDLSTDNRLDMIYLALERFLQRPFFGYGIDSFRILTKYPSYSHNNFVEILHNFGLIGFLSYYYIYFVISYFVLYKWKYLFKKDRFLILSSLLCLLINDLTVVSYYVKVPMILLSILIGRFIFLKQELLNGR